MSKQASSEIKVGLFVTFGTLLIMATVLILGDQQSLFTRKSKYTAHFKNVEGLIQGAKVVLGGVSVGTVDQISLDQLNRNIVVQFSINQDAGQWLRSSATLEIATQGVLGDKFLNVDGGNMSDPILPPGSDLPHKPSKDLTQFINKGDQLLISLNSIAVSLDIILKQFESEGKSNTIFQGLAQTAKNLSQASDSLNHELADLKAGKISSHVSQIVEKINNGTGTIGALINDPGIYDEMKTLLGGANRNRMVRNIVRQTLQDSQENEIPPRKPQTKEELKH